MATVRIALFLLTLFVGVNGLTASATASARIAPQLNYEEGKTLAQRGWLSWRKLWPTTERHQGKPMLPSQPLPEDDEEALQAFSADLVAKIRQAQQQQTTAAVVNALGKQLWAWNAERMPQKGAGEGVGQDANAAVALEYEEGETLERQGKPEGALSKKLLNRRLAPYDRERFALDRARAWERAVFGEGR